MMGSRRRGWRRRVVLCGDFGCKSCHTSSVLHDLAFASGVLAFLDTQGPLDLYDHLFYLHHLPT